KALSPRDRLSARSAMLLPYRPFATLGPPDLPSPPAQRGRRGRCGAQLTPCGSDGPIPLVRRPACIEPHGSAGQRATLFDSQLQDGDVDRVNARADNFYSILVGEFLPNGGVSQVGLPVHEACRRIEELSGQAHDSRRIVAAALSEIWCDCCGAD